ncbi:FAD-dependent oxidoreductase [Pendulispora brunnea]|uniref:FAD-dependent oxidoreductase n=1 Tax=Pendulispora brunnea TaxID=2905690 RepID=A0ABZ2KSQ7_9BACT
MKPVVVVGAGAAGLGAALRLARAGCPVQVIDGAAGATSLSCGAVDATPWEDGDTALRMDGEALRLLEELGLYRLGGAVLATTAGILRGAAGADRAMLDVKALPRGAVLVPRVEHSGWDGGTLARSWSDTEMARACGLTFTAVDATILRFREERGLCDADIAARHDDGARLGWLGERLREALGRSGRCVGVILPPWLGVEGPQAEALSERVGLPCGEALAALASAAGRRFERVRDRALSRAGAAVRRGWVRRVAASPWTVELEDGEAIEASAVVLAAGGLVGGGIAYDPSEAAAGGEVPEGARPVFRMTMAAPGTLGARGRPLELPGSLFGVPPESIAWPFANDPLMDRVGLLVDASGAVQGAPGGLVACGDLVADRPRTWLEAWRSGVRAGGTLCAMLLGRENVDLHDARG